MNVIYISIDGILEPLGRSQILGYLRPLAAMGVEFSLLTMEKREHLANRSFVDNLKSELQGAGIDWKPIEYRNRPRWLAQGLGLSRLIFTSIQIMLKQPPSLIHCRSFLPALCGSVLKLIFRAPLLFDIRGFWCEERADVGDWSRSSLVYKLLSRLEHHCLRKCDGIVTLTNASLGPISTICNGVPPPYWVIPTCCDLSTFTPRDGSYGAGLERKPKLLYVGSTSLWYDFEKVIDLWKVWRKRLPQWELRILTSKIEEQHRTSLVELGNVSFGFGDSKQVAQEMRESALGVFFLRDFPSKVASAPTRLAEYMAVGVPVITDTMVGDMKDLFPMAGVCIEGWNDEAMEKVFEMALIKAKDEQDRSQRIRYAKENFSASVGANKYLNAYKSLSKL